MNYTFYLNDFKLYLSTEKRLSKNTIDSYLNDLNGFFKYVTEVKELEKFNDIQKQHIEMFANYLKRKGINSKTISRKLSSIKSFYAFCYKEKILNENISKDIRNPKIQKSLPRVLSLEQVLSILEQCNQKDDLSIRNKALIELIYGSGLRVSELLNIQLRDIHLVENYIMVLGKGSKERMVPITDISKKAIIDYMTISRKSLLRGTSNFLFLNAKGNQLSRQGFFKIIKNLCLNAGINFDVSPHTLRHSFATHLLENGCDLKSLQMLLGHEDISTTQIYTHISKNQARKTFEKNHPRNKIISDDK